MKLRRIHTLEYEVIRTLMVINIWYLGFKIYRNPFISFRVVSRLLRNYNRLIGGRKIIRGFKMNGTYRWDMFNPAWPSQGFNRFFSSHLYEIRPINGQVKSLRRLIIAITKRCPLQCEHCCEGATLYNQDLLTYQQFIDKIEPYVQNSVGQLVWSGGEPLNRFDDLLLLLRHFKERCDQWIYTSGFGLTMEKAIQLKEAGLNGAAISLDHHMKDRHNEFRGNLKSYDWVIKAIKNLQEAGVFVSINVCPTKKYIESGGITSLIELLKKLDVPMMNLLEPRAVGNYQDKDVELHLSHKNELLKISHKYNFNRKFLKYPTVLYPAGYRNTVRCGGGHNYIFIDYDGKLYPCPYCKVKIDTVPSETDLCQVV